MDPKDPLTATLREEKDLLVPKKASAIYRKSPLIQTLQPACFGFHPVVVNDRVVGCFYLDRKEPGPPPRVRTMQILSRLRNEVAGAIYRLEY